MIRHVVIAAAGATALLAGPAFAATNSSSPPEPYTAPDPAYSPHKVISSVDIKQTKDAVSLTGNEPAPGTAAK